MARETLSRRDSGRLAQSCAISARSASVSSGSGAASAFLAALTCDAVPRDLDRRKEMREKRSPAVSRRAR